MTVGQAAAEELGQVLDLSTVLGAVGVFVAAYLLARATAFLLSAAAERRPSRRITIKMFIPAMKLAVYAGAVYVVVVPVLDLTSAQLLAVSGLVGAAIGFGLQDLITALVGGLVIVFEKPYQVGDKITVGDDYGEVTAIGLRATRLRTPDDTAVVVPNDALFTSNVANANDGTPRMLVTTEVSVAPGADLERATDVLEEAIVTSAYVHVDDEHPVSVRVDDGTYHRTVRGKAYVADLRDERAFESEVTERTLAAFEAHGIETPTFAPVGAGSREPSHQPPDAPDESGAE